jgi:D-arabinose 1-dehydrogenase-like Zn-dependent alcohol dehydrogenase
METPHKAARPSLRSRDWWDNPDNPGMTALYLLPSNIGFVETAPVLCAGVTVHKGLKVADTYPGNRVVISGIGGLGHMAVQYAKAMGLSVAAVDVDDARLDLASAWARA